MKSTEMQLYRLIYYS